MFLKTVKLLLKIMHECKDIELSDQKSSNFVMDSRGIRNIYKLYNYLQIFFFNIKSKQK